MIFSPPFFFTILYFRSCGWVEAVWYIVCGGGVSSSHCHYHREKQKTHMHTDSCKHKHIPLTVFFSYAQTHLPNPALSAALFQRASGFENKWRAWPFIMFRTLFFLRLECGQECVVALQALKGRKTYHAIMLEEKGERKREMSWKTGERTEGKRERWTEKQEREQSEAGTWEVGENKKREERGSGQEYLEKNSPLLLRVNRGGGVLLSVVGVVIGALLLLTGPLPLSLVFITAVMMLCAQVRPALP